MDIGKLTKRATLLRQVSATDPVFGTPIISYEPYADVWCNVQDVLPSRGQTNGQTRVRMRYRADVDDTTRLVMMRPDRTTYVVVGMPAEIGYRDGIEIVCEVAKP